MSGVIKVREGRAWVTQGYESILDAAARYGDCEILRARVAEPTVTQTKRFDLSSLPTVAQEAFKKAMRRAIDVWVDDERKSEFFVDSIKVFLRLLEGDSPPHAYAAYDRIDVREGESWVPLRRELDGIMKAVLRYADCPEIQHHLFKYWPASRHLELQHFAGNARHAFRNAVLEGIKVWEKDDQFDDAFVESMKAFMEMLDGKAPQHEYAMYS
ncbi:MAG: hypothetical protein ACQEVA_01270 [Myxococcota bacterium]